MKSHSICKPKGSDDKEVTMFAGDNNWWVSAEDIRASPGNPAPDLTPSWVRDSQSEAEAGGLDQSEARQEGMEVGGG